MQTIVNLMKSNDDVIINFEFDLSFVSERTVVGWLTWISFGTIICQLVPRERFREKTMSHDASHL